MKSEELTRVLKSIFPYLASLALTIATVASTSADGRSSVNWPFTVRDGEEVTVSRTGRVSFTWMDAHINELKPVSFRQINVIGVPEDVRQAVSGKPVRCTILLETDSETYAACRIVMGESSEGVISLIDLIRESNPNLIGCNHVERADFAKAGKNECALER